MEAISDLIPKLLEEGDPEIKIRQLFRLGSKPDVADRPRPLKVVFASASMPKLLLSRGWRLKGTNVSMRPDLSPEERVKQREAVSELRARTQNGEKDRTIVNFRVVRKRKLLFKPIVLTAPITAQGQLTLL